MKKNVFSSVLLFVLCTALLGFAGCFKSIDDPVIAGIDKGSKNAKVTYIYIKFDEVFEKSGIVDFNQDTDQYCIVWRVIETNESAYSIAKKDLNGWYVPVPPASTTTSEIFMRLGYKRDAEYIIPDIQYEGAFVCEDTSMSALCITLASM